MMIRNILYNILVMLMIPLAISAAEPVIKPAVIAPDSMYEDVINLPFDDKGVDVTVHFTFDEDANILTLAISGTRKLFVFEADTYIREAFHGKWFSRKRLHPERLRYPVLIQPHTKYLLSKQVRKGYKKPRRKHLFNRWLEYSGEIQTILAKDYPLAIDSIVQKFVVHPQATKATVTLRNILVVDPDGGLAPAIPLPKSKKRKYEFVCDKDMALTYNLTLKRNPCFGKEAQTDSMRLAASEIEEAYHRLVKTSPEGVATSTAEVDVFSQHKQYLLSQYQRISQRSECTELTGYIDRYNQYVDSIALAICHYEDPAASASAAAEKAKMERGKRKIGLNARMLLHAAHSLDDLTARVLGTKDPVLKHDLIAEGRGIINSTNAALQQREVTTSEQKNALNVYRRAERYFQKETRKQGN